ncbi:Senescence regulator S40 [Macleaya cordata]|uniref:Senescence regulator S40 n=1 Tax=Macleaya cordata TaxID=56857 RepID=A0A200R895_MACCD|nr:Senescence regulator S40 [Macleaya cordata]
MEEFQESDILWPDHHHHQHDYNGSMKKKVSSIPDEKKKKVVSNSLSSVVVVPVRIPARNSCFNRPESDEEEKEEEDNTEGMVPPHLMVNRRRVGGKMEFSVCTGNGRTLKGRDLSQVRNSILRMTGFIETF